VLPQDFYFQLPRELSKGGASVAMSGSGVLCTRKASSRTAASFRPLAGSREFLGKALLAARSQWHEAIDIGNRRRWFFCTTL